MTGLMAHIGGVPVEELAPLALAAPVLLAAARARLLRPAAKQRRKAS
jgi:hypothetical protein